MNKNRSILSLFFFILIFSFYACKKDDPIEKKLIGTWELNKITFLETNVSYPLDSFRNLRNVELTLNGDFSFKLTEKIDAFSFGPLGASGIIETYTPRNSKARFLLHKSEQEKNITDYKFSIDRDTLIFTEKEVSENYNREITYKRKFVLKSKTELDIDREDISVVDINNRNSLSNKLRFSFQKK